MKIIVVIALAMLAYLILYDELEKKYGDDKPLNEKPQPSVAKPKMPEIDKEQIKEIIRSLPIKEPSVPDIEKYIPSSPLELKGTIYGGDNPRAMFVNSEGETIYAKPGELIPNTDYTLVEIQHNLVIVRHQGQDKILKMRQAGDE
tara:strand:+ start:2053 stop:2487 length:435 start_codon:yes stop_codon:yes gene_type:complete